MRNLFFLVLLAVLNISPVLANQFDDGIAAFEQQDYKKALRIFGTLAKQGNADAQYTLWIMYAKGQGVPQNYTEAAKWYRLSAEQGVADAQNNLGLMYARGQGVTQNYAEALKLYRLSADQGNSRAQHNLGIIVKN